MQRWSHAWTPLFRARLQAAATTSPRRCAREHVLAVLAAQSSRYLHVTHTIHRDDKTQERSGHPNYEDAANIYSELLKQSGTERHLEDPNIERTDEKRQLPNKDDDHVLLSTINTRDVRPAVALRYVTPLSKNPRQKPRPIETKSNSEEATFWTQGIDAISRADADQQHPQLQLDERVEDWIDGFLDEKQIRTRWVQSMLYLMIHDKDRVLELIKASPTRSIPSKWLADAFEVLAVRYSLQDEQDAKTGSVKILRVLEHLPQRVDLSIFFYKALIPHLSLYELMELEDLFKHRRLVNNWQVMLLISQYMATHGEVARAVDIFVRTLRTPEFRGVGVPIVSRALTAIMRALVARSGGWRESLRLVDNLCQHGLVVDKRTATMLIDSVATSGHGLLAHQLYKSLFNEASLSEHRPDAYTFAALLKAYERAPEEISLLDIVAELRRHKANLQNVALANNVLSRMAKHFIHEDPARAWQVICALWAEQFETQVPLLLGLPFDELFTAASETAPQKPDDISIEILIWAYVQLHNKGYLQESDPVDVYKSFHSLVSQGVSPFDKLAAKDYAYNAFLICFVKNKETLINATDLIKDMQSPLPEGSGFKKNGPSNMSWNIFLLGFHMHQKTELADKILHYMLSIGVQPNQQTYDQLVTGYKHEGNLDGMLDALRRASESGFELSERMERSFDTFADQSALREALAKEREVRQLDFTSELQDRIGARIASDDAAVETSKGLEPV